MFSLPGFHPFNGIPQSSRFSQSRNLPHSRILGSSKEFSFCVTYNDFSQIFRIWRSPEYSNLPCPPKFPGGSHFFATYNDFPRSFELRKYPVFPNRPSLRVPQNFPGLLIFSIFIFLRISKRFFIFATFNDFPQSPGSPRPPNFQFPEVRSFESPGSFPSLQFPNTSASYAFAPTAFPSSATYNVFPNPPKHYSFPISCIYRIVRISRIP